MTSQHRLAKEKSPYLLQHANNPVDWYPWGEEAFAEATKQNKPIFLSIGYATCHWCHVMERESFTNDKIAELMNEVFINIKVDREELPDVDSVYMDFAQALMSSSGGWPLNVILTPDLKPFFAITYLPPQTRKGLLGLDQFVGHIQKIWQSEERGLVIEQADKLLAMFKDAISVQGSEIPTVSLLQKAVEVLFELVDPVFGGIKGEPKFPLSYQNDFLFDYAHIKGDSRALFYVELTLQMMYRGGIYDHVGGGFCRYCVDSKWWIPHFEKMLYDNAILASSYLKAWQYTKKPFYRKICEETLAYVLRDMTEKDGGFCSGQDAESEGKEGYFYTWTFEEVQKDLPQKEAELFCNFYGVSVGGNFEGRSVLHVPMPLEDYAKSQNLPVEEVESILQDARKKLFAKREERVHPFRDDKVITGWNGLMIDILARASFELDREDYGKAAVQCAEFICKNLLKGDELFRRYREGEARFSAVMDDYAFLIKGLLSLFTHGLGSKWLELAITLTETLEKKFKAPGGAFYFSLQTTDLILRKSEFYDGAEPSGNAIHTENLLRLYQITQKQNYLTQAEDILKAVKAYMEAYPPGACYHLISLQRYLDVKAPTVVIVLDKTRSNEKEIKQILKDHFSPFRETIWKDPKDSLAAGHAMSMEDKILVNDQTTIYVCTSSGCLSPITDLGVLKKTLETM